jgi:hypothetical protein
MDALRSGEVVEVRDRKHPVSAALSQIHLLIQVSSGLESAELWRCLGDASWLYMIELDML